MKVKELAVKNFRNIKEILLPEERLGNLNIFTGNNGQGKTNLLEALYILSGNSSFRSPNYDHLVNYEKEYFNINAKYTAGEKDLEIGLTYTRSKSKEIFLNRKKIRSKHPYIPKVVLFIPDDLYLIKGSPGRRRNFIDFMLKQISAEYAYLIEEYGKILKKRNLMLKKEAIRDKTLNILDGMLTEKAALIIMQRINLINMLEKEVRDIYSFLNKEEADIKIKYALSFPIPDEKVNISTLKARMAEELIKIRNQEGMRKTTLLGPHLDDINFYYNNKLARFFSSQGQQRNLVVALKIAEAQTFCRIRGFYPLFLLDEVLSELDYERRNLLLKYLGEAEFQTFMTAVNIDDIDVKGAAVFNVKDGSIV
ncbi:DNA replication and repair protein RecF [Thermosyntropha lipolytica DSM 11003]|uniref:DNA replication and repair protein RecF n=1 Tax=Thermosyntropha lipolytica DSM 11003 TaxID=1123382 RepID=A0A1M5QRK2_9FIRM|nr:DNA replication/repair protein RecF [Thermosyntropha lipolytica]SHH16213.1 DNA replication and repair protein RecF [Thermosyntropha lipolytica DSM 11003]